MKPNKLMLIDSLHMEVKNKLKDFNEYLNSISNNLKVLDDLQLSNLQLYQVGNVISDDQLILFKFDELAWPRSPEEIEHISLPSKEKELEDIKVIAFSFNSEIFDEVIPPFKVYELSMLKKYKKGEITKNAYRLRVVKNISKSFSSNFKESLEDITEMLSEILSQEEDSGERLKIVLTDISISSIDTLYFPKEDRDRIFETIQNFLMTARSLNVIPVSISKYNGSPLINSIILMLEKMDRKELTRNLHLLSDKLFLAGKLKIEERTPVLEYTNQIFDSPYLKEKCYILYVRLDTDLIYRIELPSFTSNYVDIVHSILLNEYKLSRKKLKKKGLYTMNKAQANLMSKKFKRNELIELIDLMIKDEMSRIYRKKIGLMANMI